MLKFALNKIHRIFFEEINYSVLGTQLNQTLPMWPPVLSGGLPTTHTHTHTY